MKKNTEKYYYKQDTSDNPTYITRIDGEYYYYNGQKLKKIGCDDKEYHLINIQTKNLTEGDTITIGGKVRLTIANVVKTKTSAKSFSFLVEELELDKETMKIRNKEIKKALKKTSAKDLGIYTRNKSNLCEHEDVVKVSKRTSNGITKTTYRCNNCGDSFCKQSLPEIKYKR